MIAELAALVKELGDRGIASEPDAPLAAYTTFRLGGPSPLLIHCRLPDEVIAAVRALHARSLPYVFIGGGSNLLVADAGLPSVVVRYVAECPAIQRHGELLHVSGGTLLDDLARYAVECGLGGLVNCSGIPGTVGGAIAGNAGAFGWQIGDALASAQLLTRDGTVHAGAPGSLGFGYRHSALKESRAIVLTATCRALPGDHEALAAERTRILALRQQKHPDLRCDACAGSFFRNLEPTSAAERRQAAGWFLEQAGAKAMQVGGAKVFDKHANIIFKASSRCRSADVLALSRRLAEAVRERFGLELVREVELLGEFAAEEALT